MKWILLFLASCATVDTVSVPRQGLFSAQTDGLKFRCTYHHPAKELACVTEVEARLGTGWTDAAIREADKPEWHQ